MTRHAEFLEGLAIGGRADLGRFALPVPFLLTRPVSTPASGVALEAADNAASGHRRLVLTSGADRIDLDFPIETPELSGQGGPAAEVAPGIWSLHWPMPAGAWAGLRARAPATVVLANARALYADGEPFLAAIREIRSTLGAAPLLWTPRLALPHRLALLTYLGVDLFDSTEALVRSAEGEYLTATLGAVDGSAWRSEGGCECPACRAGEDPRGGRHAEIALASELSVVRAALRAGRLRELVEARLTAEPALAEMLRRADRVLAGALESRAPVTSRGDRGYVLRESLYRPEARRFRERFLERYRPPPSKTLLVVVPCSRTKPYRNSPSHRRLAKLLEGVPQRARLHIASVTSPLGLVPQELEDVPPARSYDVPVTHEWDEAERTMTLEALGHLLRTGGYRQVLLHLSREEYGFLGTAFEGRSPPIWTRGTESEGESADPTLRAAATSALRETDPVPGGPLTVVREELEAIAAWQFGREAARELFAPPVRLYGRPWFQRLQDAQGTDLATWREERGLFQLTVEGARRMMGSARLEVHIDADVTLDGDLFVPGVTAADPAIRTGDAVRVMRAGAVVGTGEAALPGPLMLELRRGLAVRMRHRARTSGAPAATDTALSADGEH